MQDHRFFLTLNLYLIGYKIKHFSFHPEHLGMCPVPWFDYAYVNIYLLEFKFIHSLRKWFIVRNLASFWSCSNKSSLIYFMFVTQYDVSVSFGFMNDNHCSHFTFYSDFSTEFYRNKRLTINQTLTRSSIYQPTKQ